MTLDLNAIRQRFPALQKPAVFLDNPAGTQVAAPVIRRMAGYFVESNANHGGAFATSRISDALIDETRQACADFLGAARPEEIVFGPNMTSLTFNISRSLAGWLQPGDEILVTRLDHDANVSPWKLIAEERGCTLRQVDFHTEDGTLDLESFQQALTEKTKIAAFGYASNALGTINPVEQLTRLAKEAEALVYIDAVQFAPHGVIDVQMLGCDFLVCSAYKFFGPHVGVLYGRYELLDELKAYRVRPAPSDPPGKFEPGTGNFEGYAGVLGALEYLVWLGETFGAHYAKKFARGGRSGAFVSSDRDGSDLPLQGRALHLKQAMSAVRAYEYELSRALLDVLEETPGVTVYGLTDRRRLEERVPTVSFTLKGMHPRQAAEALDRENIYVWDGNYYAVSVTERLGLEESGGMVRVGPVHYNTVEEIERFGEALGRIAAGSA